jgi:hypothetical protein
MGGAILGAIIRQRTGVKLAQDLGDDCRCRRPRRRVIAEKAHRYFPVGLAASRLHERYAAMPLNTTFNRLCIPVGTPSYVGG